MTARKDNVWFNEQAFKLLFRLVVFESIYKISRLEPLVFCCFAIIVEVFRGSALSVKNTKIQEKSRHIKKNTIKTKKFLKGKIYIHSS